MKFVGGSVSHFTLVGVKGPPTPQGDRLGERQTFQCNRHVRYYPESGHVQCTSACLGQKRTSTMGRTDIDLDQRFGISARQAWLLSEKPSGRRECSISFVR